MEAVERDAVIIHFPVSQRREPNCLICAHLVGLSWCEIFRENIDRPAEAAADCPVFEDEREKT